MIGVHPSGSCITLRDHLTLQLMENGLIADVFPIEKWGYSIAMLAYQRVRVFFSKRSGDPLLKGPQTQTSRARGSSNINPSNLHQMF